VTNQPLIRENQPLIRMGIRMPTPSQAHDQALRDHRAPTTSNTASSTSKADSYDGSRYATGLEECASYVTGLEERKDYATGLEDCSNYATGLKACVNGIQSG